MLWEGKALVADMPAMEDLALAMRIDGVALTRAVRPEVRPNTHPLSQEKGEAVKIALLHALRMGDVIASSLCVHDESLCLAG